MTWNAMRSAAGILAGVALLGAFPALAQIQASESDKSFVASTLALSQAGIQSANLARQKSTSADVRQFAQKVAGDHATLNQQAQALAQQMSLTVDANPASNRYLASASRMQTLSGPAFDQEFIRGEMANLSMALRKFDSEIATTQDPMLKQQAQASAKTITRDLHQAQVLAQAHSVQPARRMVAASSPART